MLRAAAALAALSTALHFAPAAEAQPYQAQSRYSAERAYQQCLAERRDRQVAGAVIGGILGAVIGAEIADDDDHGRHARGSYRYDHRYDRRYGRYDRRHGGYYGRRHHSHHDGDGAAVLVGGGLGAVTGAAIAGGQDCEQLLRGAPGYDPRGYDARYDPRYDGRYDPRYDARYDPRYDDRYDPRYDERYDPRYAEPYDYGNDRLAGAPSDARLYEAPPGSRDDPRVYQAQSQRAGSDNCRWMGAGNGRQTWMCQGADGVWRPAER